MKIVRTRAELSQIRAEYAIQQQTIGFVPTMGALHNGHISLINIAKQKTSAVFVSIFVNPTQFNDPKDLEKYPRPIERDIDLLQKAGCDLLFLPSVEEIYPSKEVWDHDFGVIASRWEGAMRPGHFSGVGQVVKRLFELVNPTYAFFGQKDYQQTLIVKKLIADFNLPVILEVCPIVREDNGLAMSSRNVRLNDGQRSIAAIIYRCLQGMKEAWNKGVAVEEIIKEGKKLLETQEGVEIEYLAICDVEDLTAITTNTHQKNAIAIIALRLGGTRLIDNMLL